MEKKTMISKCNMTEFTEQIEQIVHHVANKPKNQAYWLDRLVWFDDVLWGLICVNEMTVKTFQQIRLPITKLEDEMGFKLLSRYNRPIRK